MLGVLALLAAVSTAAAPAPAAADQAAQTSAAGRWIVVLRDGVDPGAAARRADKAGARVDRVFGAALSGYAARLSGDAVQALRRDPRVLSVEPDAVLRTSQQTAGIPVGLDRIDQRRLPLSGSYGPTSTGLGVKAYVLDTGIRSTHEQFEGRVVEGLDLRPDDPAGDCNGHGTHVAGILGGRTYGVAGQVTLVPVRTLDCRGEGLTSDLVAGLDWVISDHEAGMPAVANLSLGGQRSSALDAALTRVHEDGVLVVGAAGNEDIDACRTSPASTEAVVAVGAVDTRDRRAAFSNDGRCVDIYAPGTAVLSAGMESDGHSFVQSGTSMSSPHVAGAAALLLERTPAAGPAQVREALLSSATYGVVGGTSSTRNGLLYLGPGDVVAGAAAPTRPDGLTRLQGQDRFDTAVAVSAGSFPGPTAEVFVVTGANWPDALAAGAAAARRDAPVLPVRGDSLPPAVRDELVRLAPRTVWVVGGTAAVSTAVQDDLAELAPDVRRVSGLDRYATAARLAAAFFPEVPAGAYYASGAGYADALAGGAAAARRGWPLLLTAAQSVPTTTPRYGPEVDRVVLGGTVAVSETVRGILGASRVAGTDRYDTAAATSAHAFPAGPAAPLARVAYLSTGLNFPDALAGTPSAGRDAAPVLLTDGSCLSPATLAELARLGSTARVVLGGRLAVSDAAAALTPC